MNTEIANLILKAARNKFRFDSSKGKLSFEQLWDVPLTARANDFSLDAIAKGIYKDVKEGDEISFVATKTVKSTEANEKLELVKFVIHTRLAEKAARENESKRREEKAKLLELLDKKQNQKLESLSEEELQARIAML